MSTRKQDTKERPDPQIDEGIRKWYDSCPCCLSQTYPEIKRTLDKERRQHGGQAA